VEVEGVPVGPETVDEDVLLGSENVGREADGGSVGAGRMDVIGVFAETVIASDSKSNRVAGVDGTNVRVRSEILPSGRLTILVEEPAVESNILVTATPFEDIVILTSALDEGSVVKVRADARNWKNIWGIIFPDAGDEPEVEITEPPLPLGD